MLRTTGTALRVLSSFVSLVLVSLVAASSAHAVQASASLSVIPTDWGPLAQGDVIDVVISINNTSTDTPANGVPDGVDPVPATLTGHISVLLACADPLCNSQVSGKLAFVPGAVAGCVEKDAGVASCATSGPNGVLITLKNGGITVPGGASLDIATIRIQVIDSDVGRLGIMALTDPASVRACSTHSPATCASCDASGCTLLVFGEMTPIGCPHACPERIIFRGDLATPDFFEFHGLIHIPNGINPASPGFSISLSNANGVIFQHPAGNEPPVVFVQQGIGTFTFNNNAARDTGGIAFVKVSLRDGMIDKYKIDVQLLDAMLEPKATLAPMTVSFTISGNTYTTMNDWMERPNGWLLNLPRMMGGAD